MEPHQLSNNHAVYVDSYGHILYVEIGKPSFVCKNIYPEGRNIEYTMLHTCELIRKKEQNIYIMCCMTIKRCQCYIYLSRLRRE